MGTWSEPVGLGQNDLDHFSAIKDCVYSAFWAFRYVRAYGGDAYIAVEGEHLGIPENQRTKSVRWFSHIYRELLLYKIKWSFWPLDYKDWTKADALPKRLYNKKNVDILSTPTSDR